MMDLLRAQVARFGTEIDRRPGRQVDFSKRPFTVWSDGKSYQAKSVIVATGASALLLGLPSEQKFMGFGVSACATCDGFFFKGKRVIVVGGGDTAMEEATYLTRFCAEVIVVHRRDTLRASKIMQERALANAKHPLHLELRGGRGPRPEGGKMTGVKLRDTKTGAVTEMAIDGVFVAIGHKPNTEFLAGQLPLDSKGYVQVSRASSYTPSRACSRRRRARRVYRQAVTAAGSGCMAAIDAERWLERRRTRRASASPGRDGRHALTHLTRRGPDPQGGRGTRDARVRRAVRGRGSGRPGGRDPPRGPGRRSTTPRPPTPTPRAEHRGAREVGRGGRARHLGRGHGPARDARADARLRDEGLPDRVRGDRGRRADPVRALGVPLPFVPPALQNHGNLIVSLAS
jgi:thioredoxin reductase (NADPH)